MKHCLILALSLGWAGSSVAAPAPFSNVADYGYMWWQNGVGGHIYDIQTSRYAMSFNAANFDLVALVPLKNPLPESAALTAAIPGIFPHAPPVSFSCRLAGNGSTNRVTASSADTRDAQLVECGKFFQRRWHKVAVRGGPSLNANQSGLELAAWPDRISFVLRVVPAETITNGSLEMTLGLTNLYGALLTNGTGSALRAQDGAGFVILKSAGSSSLIIDPATGLVTARTLAGNWNAGQEYSVGLIIYPAAAHVASVLKAAVAEEFSPLSVNATEVAPTSSNLSIAYDADRGWYDISLRGEIDKAANALLRAKLSLSNSTANPRVTRLNFDGVRFYIPGVTALLRDKNQNPLGIPVQLSKDWHTGTSDRWGGLWFHGLTMLTVPANSSLELELVMAGQNWGGMPSATHSQLSVIGYGGNQQWDEAALGNHGESLTYDADHVLTDNDCADCRPMLTTGANGNHSAWGQNAGGASFLRYFDARGKQRHHVGMRTRYERYCPNLAEAIFAGETDDHAMDFSFSAALFRSDDYTRGFHHLRVDVKADTSFSRLVFFQQAGDTYHYNRGTNYAYGNANSLAPLREWTATFGENRNIGTPMALTGRMAWTATFDCPAEGVYTAANYGFVIRSWRARINGRDNVPPYLVERSVAKASVLDIVPPPGVTNLKAGDFVDAEIVRIYVSRSADSYYGPNANYRTALNKYQNTFNVVLREAVGNNIKVKVQSGTLEHLYPLQIRAKGNRAEFTVTGGLGFAPVTFTGLSRYRSPALEEQVAGSWKIIDQAVHTKDFWQCDYNAEARSWEITFNVNLDDKDYQDIGALKNAPKIRSFRFHLPP